MSRTVALGVLVVVLAAIFVRLALWQLDRADQRKAANARVRASLRLPALRLTGRETAASDAEESIAYRRVIAEGSYDSAREVVVPGRAWSGAPGVELLTPLILNDGGEVWVNRGWVPSPDAETVDRSAFVETGPVRVTGFLRPAGRGERGAGGARPLVLQQQSGDSLPTYPRRRAASELSAGPHISYALQWLAFAAIALVGYGAYVRTRRRGGPS